MLVLSRKQGERILIGGEIEVRVLSVHGTRVRLGITCPGSWKILRHEVLEKELNNETGRPATETGSDSPSSF